MTLDIQRGHVLVYSGTEYPIVTAQEFEWSFGNAGFSTIADKTVSTRRYVSSVLTDYLSGLQSTPLDPLVNTAEERNTDNSSVAFKKLTVLDTDYHYAITVEYIKPSHLHSVAMRRGGAVLSAQSVGISVAGRQSPRRVDTDRIEHYEQAITVVGTIGLDIAIGDRFNDTNGQLYEVEFIDPDRSVHIEAMARLIE